MLGGLPSPALVQPGHEVSILVILLLGGLSSCPSGILPLAELAPGAWSLEGVTG
jgi:hypothetical protein